MIKKTLLFFMLVCFALLLPAEGYSSGKAEEAIDALDLYRWCRNLSSETYAGRFSGHEGYTRAAQWVADKFKEWGLRPLADGSYLQAFPSPLTEIEAADLQAETWKIENGRKVPLEVLKAEAMKDFFPLVFSDSGQNTAPLVFCGFGISAPELGYDDYQGVEVKDAFVVVFRGTPDRAERKYQYHDEHRTRMKIAMSRGARGLVYIYPEVNVHPNGDFTPNFTPLMISEAFADQLLKEQGLDCAGLKKKLAETRRPHSFPMQARFNYHVKTRHDPDAVSYNVCTWIAGSDPKLQEEVLILGGHLDGVGTQMGFFCPGANDNASGSAVLMGIARGLANLERPPARSLMVVLFGGEEKGMQGSQYFAANLPAPFKKMAVMFNFDMVGAGNRAFASISTEPVELKETVLEADEISKLLAFTRPMSAPGVRGGDVTAFWNMGVPCVYFMTNGPFPDYHRPGDSIYRVNPEIMADLARLALRAALIYADRRI